MDKRYIKYKIADVYLITKTILPSRISHNRIILQEIVIQHKPKRSEPSRCNTPLSLSNNNNPTWLRRSRD